VFIAFLFIIAIAMRKNTWEAQCYIFVLKFGRGGGGVGGMPHFHAIIMNKKLKGSTIPPTPNPSFCCWVYKKKHKQIQTIGMITKQKQNKIKRMKNKLSSFNEKCCKAHKGKTK
jgi:hypothetical protein